ncbi:MAG: heterodisulfide reductase-related iron-sulfur binding cluster [Methanobacterium sp.]
MLYFRGCIVREKIPRIEMATKQILEKAGIDYHILDDEGCCGSFLLRTGFADDAREVMTRMAEKLKDEKVLVSCAGCYNTLKNDYKDLLGVELDVIHTSMLFEQLIKDGAIKSKKLPVNVSYHDPCHLGRHSGEYDSPREVLKATANLVEMENIKENARCCGAGGGVKSAYPELATKLAQRRIDDVLKTDAEILVTSCSFCLINLEGACENPKGIRVMDLSEILLWALNEEKQ